MPSTRHARRASSPDVNRAGRATFLVAAGALMLAGCALSEGSLRQQDQPLTYDSRVPPGELARCLAKNMESHLLGAHATIRPLESPPGLEVIARGGDNSIYALADITADGGGSKVEMWFSQILRLYRGAQEQIGRAHV